MKTIRLKAWCYRRTTVIIGMGGLIFLAFLFSGCVTTADHGLMEFPLDIPVRTVSTGNHTTCAIGFDGEAYCVGQTINAQPPQYRFKSVETGYRYACGITVGNDVVCWLYGDGEEIIGLTGKYRELALDGDPYGIDVDGVVQRFRGAQGTVAEAQGEHSDSIVEIAAGHLFACWLKRTGVIECDTSVEALRPPEGTFISLDCAELHCCAVDLQHQVHCWGMRDNSFDVLSPPEHLRLVVLSVGRFHVCGITEDAELVCWGNNDEGQSEPPSGKFRKVSVGWFHTCAIDCSNRLYCWGSM